MIIIIHSEHEICEEEQYEVNICRWTRFSIDPSTVCAGLMKRSQKKRINKDVFLPPRNFQKTIFCIIYDHWEIKTNINY